MLIIFEGMDKTGKTTLLNKLNKATNFEHVVLDRGVISSYVYDKVYGRNFREKYDFFLDMIKNTKHLVILCVASEEVIRNRLKAAGEELPAAQEEFGIQNIQLLFYDELEASGLNFDLMLTEFDEDYLIEYIKERIQKWSDFYDN